MVSSQEAEVKKLKDLLKRVYNLDYGFDGNGVTTLLQNDQWIPLYEDIAEVFENDE